MGRAKQGKKEEWRVTFTAPDARILIVDDNRVNLKMAEGLLRPYHMQVETADSGERAVEMARDGAYDLVFMDYRMPGMNGVDAARIIRGMEERENKRPVIVALSADVDQNAGALFLEAGMDDFLTKPIERYNVDKILCRWLPKDMIESDGNEPGELKATEDLDLSAWQMDGIDVALGMSYSDNDTALYLEILTDFADSIQEKADQIECAAEEEDLTVYIMGVHSLKSAARYLGAAEVADMAQALEAEAKRGNWESIRGGTPQFLSAYRKLYQSIAPYRIDRSCAGKKKSFDREEVLGLLVKLSACMEDYDVDGGEEVIRALGAYDFGKRWSGRVDRIVRAVDRFDYDVCKAETLSLIQALEKES